MVNAVRKPVSVCMAVYNGERYLKDQIESILCELDHESDELIIIDDFSEDRSKEIIGSYQHHAIRFYKNNSNLGYKKTFEKAIQLSENPVVFLSDQDDLWITGRLMKMYERLIENDNLIVCSNFKTFDEENKSIVRFKTKLVDDKDAINYHQNISRIFRGNIAYFGCTMAFSRDLKKYILPFPKYMYAHDLWIAMVGNVIKRISHLEDITLLHRIHQNNASFIQRKLYKKLFTRLMFFRALIEANRRKYFL